MICRVEVSGFSRMDLDVQVGDLIEFKGAAVVKRVEEDLVDVTAYGDANPRIARGERTVTIITTNMELV